MNSRSTHLAGLGGVLLLLAGAAIAYLGFLKPRPFRGYPPQTIDQIEDAATRQIVAALGEAERLGLDLEGETTIDPGGSAAQSAQLLPSLYEARAMRREAARERLVRRYRTPATAAWVAAFAAAIAVPRWRRRRAATPAAGGASGGVSYRPASPQESWARHQLGVGAFTSVDEVEAAFRQAIAQYHPDKVSHLGKELRDVAERKARELVKARDILLAALGVPSPQGAPPRS